MKALQTRIPFFLITLFERLQLLIVIKVMHACLVPKLQASDCTVFGYIPCLPITKITIFRNSSKSKWHAGKVRFIPGCRLFGEQVCKRGLHLPASLNEA